MLIPSFEKTISNKRILTNIARNKILIDRVGSDVENDVTKGNEIINICNNFFIHQK
tara:strand:+ start:288 stop:455 length:168 start_codon:yes stop_codon:yes gene_type:complete